MLLLPLMNLGFAAGFPRVPHQLGYLNGATLAGYCETYDGAFLDGRVRDVVEGQPNVVTNDDAGTTMRVGVKQTNDADTTYSTDSGLDPFTGRATWDPPPSGRFIRARVTNDAATALNGCTLFLEMGGV